MIQEWKSIGNPVEISMELNYKFQLDFNGNQLEIQLKISMEYKWKSIKNPVETLFK